MCGTSTGRVEELSLFFPMYNEERNISQAVESALRVLPRVADRFEIIIVDDGSRDHTGDIADEMARSNPAVHVVHHPTNLGYGAALQSGIRASHMDWIFYTDGDNQFDLEEMPLVLERRDGSDIVAGYRIDRRDAPYRKAGAWLYNRAACLLFCLRMRDVDCAFKLFRASLVRSMPLKSTGALIDVEILARAKLSSARIRQVGVHHFARRSGHATGFKPAVILRAFRELFLLRRELHA